MGRPPNPGLVQGDGLAATHLVDRRGMENSPAPEPPVHSWTLRVEHVPDMVRTPPILSVPNPSRSPRGASSTALNSTPPYPSYHPVHSSPGQAEAELN